MVPIFGKVNKFPFIFLQMFGSSGNKKVYRRDYLAEDVHFCRV